MAFFHSAAEGLWRTVPTSRRLTGVFLMLLHNYSVLSGKTEHLPNIDIFSYFNYYSIFIHVCSFFCFLLDSGQPMTCPEQILGLRLKMSLAPLVWILNNLVWQWRKTFPRLTFGSLPTSWDIVSKQIILSVQQSAVKQIFWVSGWNSAVLADGEPQKLKQWNINLRPLTCSQTCCAVLCFGNWNINQVFIWFKILDNTS